MHHSAQSHPAGLAGPLLLVDKTGLCTDQLLSTLHSSFRIVYLGTAMSQDMANVHHVPFGKLLPKLPDFWYSHMLVFFNGEQEVQTILPSLLSKAKKDNAHLIVVTFLPYAHLEFIEKLTTQYNKTSILIIGDLFGTPKPYRKLFLIDRLLQQARNGRVTLSSSGTKRLYPVLFTDAVDAILKSFLGSITRYGCQFVFPLSSLTDFSLARVLSHEDSSLKIDFAQKEKHQAEERELPEGTSVLDDSYDTLQKIRDEFSKRSLNPAEPVSVQELLKDEGKRDMKKNDVYSDPDIGWGEPIKKRYGARSFFRFLLLFIVFSFVIPPVVTLLCGAVGGITLLHAKNTLEQGKLSESQQSARVADALFSVADNTSFVLTMEGSVTHLDSFLAPLTTGITTGRKTSLMMEELTTGAALIKSVLGKTSQQPKADFTGAVNDAKSALSTVQEMSLSGQQSRYVSDKLQLLSGASQFLSATADVLPHIFGFETPKTYLVLFSNNMELRPGGGFIGSYGLLTLSYGSVQSFVIHDVYETDGQLKKHVEPPYFIRRYMKQQHLYVRDANYDVDFPTNASRIADIYHLETGKKVDGIVSVDLSIIKTILQATGPVKVTDYNETVTADNVSELTEQHVEKNFFPGSTQKKDFLNALLLSIQKKMESGDSFSALRLFSGLSDAIESKHIVMAFAEPNIETLFAVNGYSSSLVPFKNTSADIPDFLNITEANIGTNKVNYFIRRKLTQGTTIGPDNTVSETATVSYKNLSTNWLGGEYKNYLQVVVPKGSLLTDVVIDGKPQQIVPAVTSSSLYEQPGFQSPPGLEVSTQESIDKTVFGFLVTIPKDAYKTVQIRYSLPYKVPIDAPAFTYTVHIFKQPGTDSDPLDFSLSYPQHYQIVKMSGGVQSQSNVAYEKIHLTTDSDISLNFAQK